jgi:xanthine dehydrogenase accessory factor
MSVPAAEAEDLVAIALAWRSAGQGVALATVVETWGSAPRAAGSQMVCNAAGGFAGSVSGGCVEIAVLEAAQAVIASGRTQLLSFGVSDEQAWSVGLACGGRIRVFVEPVDAGARQSALESLQVARAAGEAVARITPLDGGLSRQLGRDALDGESAVLAEAVRSALATDRAAVVLLDEVEHLVAPCNPPLRLVVVGAVHIAEFLCRMARLAGYAVTVVDPRSAFLRPERFPEVALVGEWPQQAFAAIRPDARTAVVLLTHDPKIDDPALECVLAGPAFYVGALGSTRTQTRRLERLAGQGMTAEQLARIHGPAGLAIGARTPAEIAVSVLAQMTQALRQGAA